MEVKGISCFSRGQASPKGYTWALWALAFSSEPADTQMPVQKGSMIVREGLRLPWLALVACRIFWYWLEAEAKQAFLYSWKQAV